MKENNNKKGKSKGIGNESDKKIIIESSVLSG